MTTPAAPALMAAHYPPPVLSRWSLGWRYGIVSLIGPWISGFDPATIREQLAVLRTACYIFTAALTMMRDSELLSIPKNSVATFHGTPAVTSFVYKSAAIVNSGSGGSSSPWRRPLPSQSHCPSTTMSSLPSESPVSASIVAISSARS